MAVDFITVHLDNTISIQRCKTRGDRVLVRDTSDNPWTPKITAGRCVFMERPPQGRWKSFKWKIAGSKTHRYVIAVEDSPSCFELDPRDGFLDDHWSIGEARKFIAKLVSMAAASQKPFTTWQVILLFAGFMGVMILQLLVLRRIGF